MELTIKIEDKEFEKSIVDGVTNLKDDQLVEIVCKCVEAFLMKESNMEKLLMYKPYYANEYKPTDWVTNLLGQYEGSAIDDMKEEAVKFLKENYHQIVFKALVAALSKQLLTVDFKTELHSEIMEMTNRENR